MIERLFETVAVEAIGWSLVAFVWQGALVGALTALLLWGLGDVDPRWRYAAACLGLLVMTALPIRTTFVEYRARVAWEEQAILETTAVSSTPFIATAAESTDPSAAETTTAPLVAPKATPFGIGTLVALWLGGVGALSLRLAGGWLLVWRLRTTSVQLGGDLPGMVRTLARRLHVIPRIRIRGSSLVDVPTVVGWTRPLILVPATAISGLTRLELEAILAHELAHIRRHDYGINLLQRVSETLLFFHPAVWWLSARIRQEREMCADDLAVNACGDRMLYASALRNLERSRSSRALVVAANGGSLGARVRRLLGPPSPRDRWSPVWTSILLGGLALGAAVLGSPEDTRAAVPPAQEAAEPQESPEPAPVTPEPIAEAAESVEAAPTPEAAVVVQVTPEPRVAQDPAAAYRGILSGQKQAFGQIVQPTANTAWLGVTVDDGIDEGAVVRSVEPESPAAEAGLDSGDVITGLDGIRVVGSRQFSRMIGETPVGRTVTLTVLRNDQVQTRTAVLSNRPVPEPQFVALPETFSSPLESATRFLYFGSPDLRLGLEAQQMTPELRAFFGAAADRGVLVASVLEGSSAAGAGILVGDVIVAVAGNPVRGPEDLNWSGELEGDMLILEIVRDGASRRVTLRLNLPPRSLRIGP